MVSLLQNGGNAGDGDGEFDEPLGIAVDSYGNVYVTDSNNNRVQKFTSDGTFIKKWGNPGSGDGEFSYSAGIAVDPEDNVYVGDNTTTTASRSSPLTAPLLQNGGILVLVMGSSKGRRG